MNTNLPTLTGSEKQIAWATKLRAGMLDCIDRKLALKELSPTAHIRPRDAADRASKTAKKAWLDKYLTQITDAGFWIDTREAQGPTVMSAAVVVASADRDVVVEDLLGRFPESERVEVAEELWQGLLSGTHLDFPRIDAADRMLRKITDGGE